MVTNRRPSIRTTRNNLRSTPFGDIPDGSDHWHLIRSSSLTTELRTRIDAVDLTVHELMELAIIELRIGNLLEMELSEKRVTEDDVVWP